MFLAAIFVAAVLLLFDFPQPQVRDNATIVVELIQQQLEAEEKVAAITLDADGQPTGTTPVEGL